LAGSFGSLAFLIKEHKLLVVVVSHMSRKDNDTCHNSDGETRGIFQRNGKSFSPPSYSI